MEGRQYFFSYARNDSEFVLKLAQELRNRGANLWRDQLDILGGERWDHAVEQSLQACEGMIVVLSADAVSSQNVMDEVSYALEEGKLINSRWIWFHRLHRGGADLWYDQP